MLNYKLYSPKNQGLNDLICFINEKYYIEIANSFLDNSYKGYNRRFGGFSEANGRFILKFIEAKSKSNTRKISIS